MSLQEGQPIRDDFDGLRDAYASFCGCNTNAAAAIVARRSQFSRETYEATIKRLTQTCLEQIEKHAKGEPR